MSELTCFESCFGSFVESINVLRGDCGVLLHERFKESFDDGFDVLYRGVLLLVPCNISFDVLAVYCMVLPRESRDEGFKEEGTLCVWVECRDAVVNICKRFWEEFRIRWMILCKATLRSCSCL
jgi:hypothetical protein